MNYFKGYVNQCLDSVAFDISFLVKPLLLALFRLGFLRVAQLGGGGGGKVPAAYNSTTINDNEMKLGGVVKDH